MKERPIIFSGPMVRAILEGRKTQTRRIIKPQPGDSIDGLHGNEFRSRAPYDLEDYETGRYNGYGFEDEGHIWISPFGKAGDRLWVREKWAEPHYWTDDIESENCGFAVEYPPPIKPVKWRPSIFMPKYACRIKLLITKVRVEKLKEITEADAIAEGIKATPGRDGHNDRWIIESSTSLNGLSSTSNPVVAYQQLWESINGPDSWELNPWVWVIEFERVK